MNRLLAAAVAVAAAGCTTAIEPGVRESYTTRADWKGAALAVQAAPGGAACESTPGAITYSLDPATWNAFFAKTLAEDVRKLGAADAAEPVLTIGLAEVVLEDRAMNQAFFAAVTVKVEIGGSASTHTGKHESGESFEHAVHFAATDAVKTVVEDLKLRQAATK